MFSLALACLKGSFLTARFLGQLKPLWKFTLPIISVRLTQFQWGALTKPVRFEFAPSQVTSWRRGGLMVSALARLRIERPGSRPGYWARHQFAISASKHGGQLWMNVSFIWKTSLQIQDIWKDEEFSKWLLSPLDQKTFQELKGRDSRKQIIIFKKVTTCFNFKDMLRCCQHHRQLQNIWKTVGLYNNNN